MVGLLCRSTSIIVANIKSHWRCAPKQWPLRIMSGRKRAGEVVLGGETQYTLRDGALAMVLGTAVSRCQHSCSNHHDTTT